MSRENITLSNATPYDFVVKSYSGDHFYGPEKDGKRPGYIPQGTTAPANTSTQIGQITDPSYARSHTGSIQFDWEGLSGVAGETNPYIGVWMKAHHSSGYSYSTEATYYADYVKKDDGPHVMLDNTGQNSYLLKYSATDLNLNFFAANNVSQISGASAIWLKEAPANRSTKAFFYIKTYLGTQIWVEYHGMNVFAVFNSKGTNSENESVLYDPTRDLYVKLTPTHAFFRAGPSGDWNLMDQGGYLDGSF